MNHRGTGTEKRTRPTLLGVSVPLWFKTCYSAITSTCTFGKVGTRNFHESLEFAFVLALQSIR